MKSWVWMAVPFLSDIELTAIAHVIGDTSRAKVMIADSVCSSDTGCQ
ncbi:hypothetical protein N9383_04535 [Granulosicoccus sp.]|nr:hypothetical protein [Granulosicoccus sp.]